MRSGNILLVSTLLWVLIFGLSCQQPAAQTKRPVGTVEKREIVKDRTAVLQEAHQKREARTQQLKSMDIPRLAQELETDSQKGIEPFNSLAFGEMIARGREAAGALAPLITKPERSFFFALLALRKIDPDRYKELKQDLRVKILIDALKTSKYFNTWGLPHVRWEDAAKAIIEEGTAAEQPLRALFKDKRPAPTWGSEDYAEYQRYRYRVSDYAWALINEIKGEKIAIPEDPASRDRLQ